MYGIKILNAIANHGSRKGKSLATQAVFLVDGLG